MTTVAVQGRFDLIPTHLAMVAMRDNGYKNTAYALAELIDNSIQAGGRDVEVLCSEREEQLPQRVRRRIDQIGVIDNGSGMDATTLRMAPAVWERHAPRRPQRDGPLWDGAPKRLDLAMPSRGRLDVAVWHCQRGSHVHRSRRGEPGCSKRGARARTEQGARDMA